jgi:hypothetical protein
MNIEKIIYILLLCFIHTLALQAQTSQNDLIKAAQKEVRTTRNTKPLSDLIASGQLTENRYLATAYIQRAKMNQRIDKKHLNKFVWEEPIRDSLVLSILADYEQAIRTCPSCDLVIQKKRYEFLHEIAPKTEMFKDDFAKIKAAGYKPNQEGVMLSLHAWQRNGWWLGGSISPFGIISPYYRMRFKSPSTDKKDKFYWKTPYSFNALALGYSRKINRNLNDVSFSVFQMHAPIVLNLTTLGAQFGKDTEGEKIAPRWYYRPEIGVGIGHLSLSAGYDLFFKKSARKASDQFFVQLRYAFIAN